MNNVSMKLMIQLNETWYEQQLATLDTEQREDCQWSRASFTNQTDKTIRFGGFRFELDMAFAVNSRL